MQRIQSQDQRFHNGDPFNGVQGTAVTAEFLNALQEEVSGVIESAGIALDVTKTNQLRQAIATIAGVSTTRKAGDSTTAVATDEFVQIATGGIATVDLTGGGDVSLLQEAWGQAIIVFTGVLANNINVIVPAKADQWVIVNQMTGAFSLGVKTLAGAPFYALQGQSYHLICDGTNILPANSDPRIMPGSNSSAYVNSPIVLVAGTYDIDTAAGAFPIDLPPNPKRGTCITLVDTSCTWGTQSPTLRRNGKTIMNIDEDMLINVEDITFSIWFNGSTWRLK
ncbi:hypothetical protein GTP58_28470 [Duganella sp. CY15W]|uniref:hypothetical protein n=1 Tax=Duganella sp. CY15W TaxID=2692172 RepID=UPI00136ECFEC|nr:hypothetical protein [Duganella sp. CY15W]MYM32272.1 hypothetical protein [Duganella sp. CY15W]